MENKQYTWAEDAKIEFKGSEFGAMLNGLKIFINEPLSPGSINIAVNVYNILDQKFKTLIEEGIAKEQVPDAEVVED